MPKGFHQKEIHNEIYMDCCSDRWSYNSLNFFLCHGAHRTSRFRGAKIIKYTSRKGDIRVNFPFVVNINFEADGKPEIRTACFSFSGDGPYCFKVTDVNYGSPGTIKVQIRAKNSGSHALESYVYYIRDGKVQATNIVNCNIRVIP